MTDQLDAGQYIPADLLGTGTPEAPGFELYPKLQAVLNHLVAEALADFSDVQQKYAGPDVTSNDVIQAIIEERGFGYIADVMTTLANFSFTTIFAFAPLINLLKGSRPGLELVLQLLGMNAIVTEWWEQNPRGEPMTFIITVLMNTSIVPNPSLTLTKIQAFCQEYVYPTISNIDFKFQITFAERNANMGGFIRASYGGQFLQALPL